MSWNRRCCVIGWDCRNVSSAWFCLVQYFHQKCCQNLTILNIFVQHYSPALGLLDFGTVWTSHALRHGGNLWLSMELGSMILVGPFQLSTFCDSVRAFKFTKFIKFMSLCWIHSGCSQSFRVSGTSLIWSINPDGAVSTWCLQLRPYRGTNIWLHFSHWGQIIPQILVFRVCCSDQWTGSNWCVSWSPRGSTGVVCERLCPPPFPSFLLSLVLSSLPAFFFSPLLWLPLSLANNLCFKVKLSYAIGFIFINCIGLTLSLPQSWYF